MARSRGRVFLTVLSVVVILPGSGRAQGTTTPYPTMAPVEQYRIASSVEIALAKSAAPESISALADILVMGASGYETAAKGTNGFVCLVERSWDQGFENPEFWNPKTRVPICYNPPAARSVLPDYLTRTKWVLQGVSLAAMKERSSAHPVGAPEVGALCYMMSKDGWLGDKFPGPWHPHLMFILPRTSAAVWGAGVNNSPLLLLSAPGAAQTVVVVAVPRWGDGSQDSTTADGVAGTSSAPKSR